MPVDRELVHLHRAEAIVARLRWMGMLAWAVILWHTAAPVRPAIVWSIYAGCLLYTIIVQGLVQSGRAIRETAIATTAGDATITALICSVTHGIYSDFYPYFYLTVPATSIRFGVRETFLVLAYNSFLSGVVYLVAPDQPRVPGDLALRIFYLFFLALIGALLSREARESFRLALQERDRSRALLWRLIHAGEEERKRVAGEIHDRMGRQLFELTYGIDRARETVAGRDAGADRALAALGVQARGCSDEIRHLMNELRPPVLDDFGFSEALREFAAALEEQGELAVTLAVDATARSTRPEVNVTLFRILQEAILNVRKHAAARRLAIEYRGPDDGRLSLVVRDDGCGFEPGTPARGHFGLLAMRERAEACGGALAIRSARGGGTEIRVTVPAA